MNATGNESMSNMSTRVGDYLWLAVRLGFLLLVCATALNA
jgi:hypothetical protein